MGKIIAEFTMSLDGFIAEPDDNIKQLLSWYFNGDVDIPTAGGAMVLKVSHASAGLVRERFQTTGALVTGRRDFDVSHAWGGNPPYDVPAFIVTHKAPQEWLKQGSPFTFVTDGVESAIKQARNIAGEKNVVVGGSKIVQQCLQAGLLDEIRIDLAPILLCTGIRLFEHLGTTPIELERLATEEGTDITHLRFRVLK
ncbi:MAG: dihydrofolate reductase family protein [Anaerolineales bacterium]|nr:dihydrofolate reductase family protein [Anaerolineales bacterium]